MKNRQWTIARGARPGEMLAHDVLEWRVTEVPDLESGQVLVRTLLLSLDPANRVWLTLGPSYLDEPLHVGSVMPGFVIGRVEESRAEGFAPGDLVTGLLGWQDFTVVPPSSVQHLPDLPGLPLDAFLGLVSVVGLTAYVGIIDVLEVQAGETVLVSGAAGASGSLAGQIARIRGARVIGIAGGTEKCSHLVE